MEALQTEGPPAAAPPAAVAPTLSALPQATEVGLELTPTVTANLAPDPATAAPTVPTLTPEPPTLPEPSVTSVPTLRPTVASGSLPPLMLPTRSPLSNEERWRQQQLDRQPFEAPVVFSTVNSELWWFDPVHQQSVILGQINGSFLAQAEFTLRSQGIPALEVPYQIEVSYGLTSLSPALLERMHLAGYTDWIETYVFVTSSVSRR
ncbi:hypothetical protein [Candidatus Viridilinea mediisalina]|nr:hypothetical protein [Candidatus Viridilinea mediisalina]